MTKTFKQAVEEILKKKYVLGLIVNIVIPIRQTAKNSKEKKLNLASSMPTQNIS
jgi:hypothetical protein